MAIPTTVVLLVDGLNLALAVVQMCAGADPAANLARAGRFVREAKAQGCSLVCFPENFDFLARTPEEGRQLAQPQE